MDDLAMLGSGVMVVQFLRAHGLNPEGNIKRFVDKETDCMIYTEILPDEECKAVGEISAVEGGVRDDTGGVCPERDKRNLWL